VSRPARSPASRTSNERAPQGVGVDTGGTFTDFVARRGRTLVALKLPSTPRAPERAVLEGLARLDAGKGTRVRHGSTVATNALLERKGARVTFVTTRGFEDLLEIGRQDRPDLYSLLPRRVPPLVPRARRLGATERCGPDGAALAPLTVAEAQRVARAVRRTRPEAIAIGLLHAYANDTHERRLAHALLGMGVPVTCSSSLCPEVREFERFATTVTNAYLMPHVAGYLRRLAAGSRAELEIVLSHGGTAPPEVAAREPVRQLLSGPAAGLEAAWRVAQRSGFDRALTLDVGGTSTDCAFVAGGLPRRRAREIAGFPVLLPVLDVQTVGAGGGSIASLDPGGMLHVGPESAGSQPGPACYGRGGPATVTDALVVLGRIAGDSLAGGTLPLDRNAAQAALAGLGRALARGTPATVAAHAVVEIANARMEAALRRVSVEAGNDPRGAALVAFGGAGGLHACELAEALGCSAVLFPRHAGVLSALGALEAGSRRERGRSVLLDARDSVTLERAWRDLERGVRSEFARRDRAGLSLERWAELRYRGQSHELPLQGGVLLLDRFHREHERRFGFSAPERVVEVVTLEVRGTRAEPQWRSPAPVRAAARRGAARRTRVHVAGRWRDVSVFHREALTATKVVKGPAIVVEDGATLWVGAGWRGRPDRSGTLVLLRSGR
jgi:N-methylhydantoinase A